MHSANTSLKRYASHSSLDWIDIKQEAIMSRTIKVVDGEGNPDYVVVEFRQISHKSLAGSTQSLDGSAEFFLSNGDDLNLMSAERFEDLDGFSYYAQDKLDIEWLNTL